MARKASRTTSNFDGSPIRARLFGDSSRIPRNRAGRRQGFTIVELLIVVVVIAILAAITIVSYNGISNRAKNSAAASAAEQVAKKVLTYAITNADQYPSALVDAGLSDGSATYQYRADNSANPRTFCVTATTRNVSYFVSETQSTPRAGACVGHGADGASTVTNLVSNPKATTGDGWLVHYIDGGTLAQSAPQAGGPSGNNFIRFTMANPSNSGSFSVGFGRPETAQQISLTGGKTYAWSMWVRSSRALPSSTLRVRYMAGSTPLSDAYGNFTQVAPGAWTRLSYSGTTPSGANNGRILFSVSTASPLLQTGDTLDVTMAAVTDGPALIPYFDGDSPGWAWTGEAGNSTSTGPAQ
jgi:prepilin-type N-terminal cleavage/methylation domain-containing protein